MIEVHESNKYAEGHRERFRARYRLSGEAALQDYELLEFLLTFANQRRDATHAAHGRLGRAGSPYGMSLKIHHEMVENLPLLCAIPRRTAMKRTQIQLD